jgi:hypothetical protein
MIFFKEFKFESVINFLSNNSSIIYNANKLKIVLYISELFLEGQNC